MFGGGRNQQNGPECLDGWGGSARQGGVVDGEMADVRRSQKEAVMPLCVVRRPDRGFFCFETAEVVGMIVYRHGYYIKTYSKRKGRE